MKRALSHLDDRELDAATFSTQDIDWQKSRRGTLACLGCASPAYFRAPTTMRAASFGAMHTGNCPLRMPWTVFRYLQ